MKKISRTIILIFLFMFLMTGCSKSNKAISRFEDSVNSLNYESAYSIYESKKNDDEFLNEADKFMDSRIKNIYSTLSEDNINAGKAFIEFAIKIGRYPEADLVMSKINDMDVDAGSNENDDAKEEDKNKAEENKEDSTEPSAAQSDNSNQNNSQSNDDRQNVSNEISYKNYTNSRYGFSIKYPTTLSPTDPPTNGDGREFKSSDGLVDLKVYGSNNIFSDTVDGDYNRTLSNTPNVSYSNLSSNSYVVSWSIGERIYYLCSYVGEGSKNTFIITYPAEQSDVYNNVVTELYNSFTTGNLTSSH